MVESLIVLPVVLLVALAAFELIMGYRAYLAFDAAVQQAARLGSLHHGQYHAMRRGLVQGLLPLMTRSAPGASSEEVKQAIFDGGLKATFEVDNYMSVKRKNPKPGMFQEHGEPRLSYDGSEWRNIEQISPYRLGFRDPTPRGGISVQDANILQIVVEWCYPLKSRLFVALFNAVGSNSSAQAEDPVWERSQQDSVCDSRDGSTRSGIPLRTDGLARMQSPVWKSCNEREGLTGETCSVRRP